MTRTPFFLNTPVQVTGHIQQGKEGFKLGNSIQGPKPTFPISNLPLAQVCAAPGYTQRSNKTVHTEGSRPWFYLLGNASNARDTQQPIFLCCRYLFLQRCRTFSRLFGCLCLRGGVCTAQAAAHPAPALPLCNSDQWYGTRKLCSRPNLDLNFWKVQQHAGSHLFVTAYSLIPSLFSHTFPLFFPFKQCPL